LLGAFFFLQQKSDIQWRAVGQSLAKAFPPVQLRLADCIAMKIEHALPVIAFNAENFSEHRLQSPLLPLGLRDLRLQKFLVRIGLQFDQVGRSNDFFNLTEVNSFCGSRWHFNLNHYGWFYDQPVISSKRHKASTLYSTANLPDLQPSKWLR